MPDRQATPALRSALRARCLRRRVRRRCRRAIALAGPAAGAGRARLARASRRIRGRRRVERRRRPACSRSSRACWRSSPRERSAGPGSSRCSCHGPGRAAPRRDGSSRRPSQRSGCRPVVAEVPSDPAALGREADATRPAFVQAIVERPAGLSDARFELRLVLARRRMETAARAAGAGLAGFAVPSASCRTVVYKGLVGGRSSG